MRTLLFVSLVVAGPALAQQPNPPAPAPTAQLRCDDFTRNPDGSWSALHPVTINGVTLGGPGVRFREGVAFGGVDLAAILNQRCH